MILNLKISTKEVSENVVWKQNILKNQSTGIHFFALINSGEWRAGLNKCSHYHHLQHLSVCFSMRVLRWSAGTYFNATHNMINKSSTIQDHKTALYPSSALLEQWLTFEFMSSFALASDKVFYEFFPPRQLGLNLSSLGR